MIATDRFISTGNVFDLGTGVVPAVKRDAAAAVRDPQFTFLVRLAGQPRLGGVRRAVATTSPTGSRRRVALRYDDDERENTTETPTEFIPARSAAPTRRRLRVHGPGPQGDLGRAAAEGHAALQAERRRDDSTAATAAASAAAASTRRASGSAGDSADRHRRPVRRGDRGHLRGRRQGAVRRRPRHDRRERLPHEGRRARISSCSTRTRARRTSATSTRSNTRASRLEFQAQVDDDFDLYARGGCTDSEIKESAAQPGRRRQPGAARFRVHRQPRRAAAGAARVGGRLRASFRAGLPDHRRHLVVSGQLHASATRSRSARPARRHRGGSAGRSSPGRGTSRTRNTMRNGPRGRSSSRARATRTTSCSRRSRMVWGVDFTYRF